MSLTFDQGDIAMKSLVKRLSLRSRNGGRPVRSRPVLEQLETREVLSQATLSVATAIVHSAENFGNFITTEYQHFLHRPPDPVGFNNWVAELRAGRAPESVEAAFTSSLEYLFDQGNNNANWILGLYRDVLNRVPSDFEVNFWLQRIAAGGVTPFQITLAFSTSNERQDMIVVDAYSHYLARPPEPGAELFWLSQFQLGMNRATFVSLVVGSDEFFLRQGGNNVNFIIGVYQTVLLRTPSQPEVNFWLSVMNGTPI
jgi:hypothetical protein